LENESPNNNIKSAQRAISDENNNSNLSEFLPHISGGHSHGRGRPPVRRI